MSFSRSFSSGITDVSLKSLSSASFNSPSPCDAGAATLCRFLVALNAAAISILVQAEGCAVAAVELLSKCSVALRSDTHVGTDGLSRFFGLKRILVKKEKRAVSLKRPRGEDEF